MDRPGSRAAPGRSCTIENGIRTRWRCGNGALELLPREWPSGRGRPVVVADRRAWALWGPAVVAALRPLVDSPHVVGVPSGERSKHAGVWARLLGALVRAGVDRQTGIVAVGGGAATDLAGFAASTLHRGVPLLLVPTTLVGQVDAAIGGKTALDLPEGKNLAGSWHWPVVTLADPRFLSTLTRRHLRNGVAEMVKAGMVGDPGLLDILDAAAGSLSGGIPPSPGAIARAATVKWDVVCRDPFERGERRVLNLGHTAGHAIEAASGYRVLHGEAVAAGMVVAVRVAVRLAGFPASGVRDLRARLRRLGLPDAPQVPFDAAQPFAVRDKKARGGVVRMALPRQAGTMEAAGGEWTLPVDESLLRECWDDPA